LGFRGNHFLQDRQGLRLQPRQPWEGVESLGNNPFALSLLSRLGVFC
jgi:hypothetical protein